MKFFKNKTEKNLQKNDFPDHILILDKKSFNDFIQSYPICLIDFWAPWCKPCRTMGPRMRRLSSIYKDKLAFGKINIQQNKEIAEKYKIMSIPTFILFISGKQKTSIYGVKSVGEIKKIIEKYV